MKILLPWPSPSLSPNARKHWAVKARAFKSYKQDCIWLLREHYSDFVGKTKFDVRFCPPDKHRRDIDNAISSAKGLIDALSYITGMDDSRFTYTFAWGEPVKGGAVEISIVEADTVGEAA